MEPENTAFAVLIHLKHAKPCALAVGGIDTACPAKAADHGGSPNEPSAKAESAVRAQVHARCAVDGRRAFESDSALLDVQPAGKRVGAGQANLAGVGL